jgi:hypothetical protein
MWLVAVVGRCVVGCEQCSRPTTCVKLDKRKQECNKNSRIYKKNGRQYKILYVHRSLHFHGTGYRENNSAATREIKI